ncbi:MAG: hypothetical protein U9N18_05650 [Campylobacterota bacterium]|nr:hypothetical protein [Campylobacterota bacterium]
MTQIADLVVKIGGFYDTKPARGRWGALTLLHGINERYDRVVIC